MHTHCIVLHPVEKKKKKLSQLYARLIDHTSSLLAFMCVSKARVTALFSCFGGFPYGLQYVFLTRWSTSKVDRVMYSIMRKFVSSLFLSVSLLRVDRLHAA